MTLLSLSAPVAYLRFRLLPRAEYVRLFDVFYIALFICGFYLLLKGAKIVKEAAAETLPAAKPKDISKPVGLVFGIITIPFSAVAFFAALGALTGVIMTGKDRYEWAVVIAWVFLGVLSFLLPVISWRLINVRKGWTGKLFAPCTLWLRIAGWLFLVAGMIKLVQRNLTGIWAIAIAASLIVVSAIKDKKIAKTS